MRLIFAFFFLSFYFLSCKDPGAHDQIKDTSSSVLKKDTIRELSSKGDRSYYIERGHLELPAYSISFLSLYLFPSGSLQHDSSFYFSGNFVTVNRKAGNITDSLHLRIDDLDDLSNCRTCKVILRNLTDRLQIQPLFIQLVAPGLDFYGNAFIGYRGGKLQELFTLGDTEEGGVDLQKTRDSTLYGFTFGIDEVIGAVQHNYPVSIDLKTFEVSHPLPEKQYIGYKTAATESFRAYRVIKGQVDSSLVNVKGGDPVIVDTFYRARQKVRLLISDSVTVEIKLETAKKKLLHPAAPG